MHVRTHAHTLILSDHRTHIFCFLGFLRGDIMSVELSEEWWLESLWLPPVLRTPQTTHTVKNALLLATSEVVEEHLTNAAVNCTCCMYIQIKENYEYSSGNS